MPELCEIWKSFEERDLKSVMRSHVSMFRTVPVAGSHFQSCVEKKQQALAGVSTFGMPQPAVPPCLARDMQGTERLLSVTDRSLCELM